MIFEFKVAKVSKLLQSLLILLGSPQGIPSEKAEGRRQKGLHHTLLASAYPLQPFIWACRQWQSHLFCHLPCPLCIRLLCHCRRVICFNTSEGIPSKTGLPLLFRGEISNFLYQNKVFPNPPKRRSAELGEAIQITDFKCPFINFPTYWLIVRSRALQFRKVTTLFKNHR